MIINITNKIIFILKKKLILNLFYSYLNKKLFFYNYYIKLLYYYFLIKN